MTVKSTVPWDWESRQKHLVLGFPVAEYEARVERLRREMEEAGLTHLIAYGNHAEPGHVRWLSGFNPGHGDNFVVIALNSEPMFATNWVLHNEPMHTEIWTTWIRDTRPYAMGDPALIQTVAEFVANTGGPSKRVGLAGQRVIPAHVYSGLLAALPVDEFADGDSPLFAARRIKSPLEIDTMRRAARATGAGIQVALAMLEPGVSERAIAGAAQGATLMAGADYLAFEPAVASGPDRAGLKHCSPSWRSLEPGDLVFIDMGSIVNGYHSDVSRCAAVGEPSPEGLRLLQAGETLFNELVKLARPGMPLVELNEEALRIADELGYGEYFMKTGMGHGLGCMLFERPSLSYKTSTDILEPGMTFAFEPMFVQYGLGTAVVEDVMLVTDQGIEPLSGLPYKLYTK